MKKIFIRLLFTALLMLSVYTLFFVLAILDLISPEESLAISSIAMFFIFVCGVVYIFIKALKEIEVKNKFILFLINLILYALVIAAALYFLFLTNFVGIIILIIITIYVFKKEKKEDKENQEDKL